MRADYAERLRALFETKAWVEFVADFGHAKKFFPDADVFPSVLVIQKPTDASPKYTIFFVPYVIFEIPSNVLMKKLKPHVWLSGCMFMFGLVTVCQGLVQNFSGLLATRFFLGFFEVRRPATLPLSHLYPLIPPF